MASVRDVGDNVGPLKLIAHIVLTLASVVSSIATMCFVVLMAIVDAIERVLRPCVECGPCKFVSLVLVFMAMSCLAFFLLAMYNRFLN